VLLHTRFPRPLLEIVEELADVGRWQGRLGHVTKEGVAVTVESRWVARFDAGGRWAGGIAIERPLPAVAEPVAAAPPPTAEAPGPSADLVHDLNNALAIIVNYAGFVAEELQQLQAAPSDGGRSTMGRDVHEIQVAAERAMRLLRELGT
jgi:hypothetical protein